MILSRGPSGRLARSMINKVDASSPEWLSFTSFLPICSFLSSSLHASLRFKKFWRSLCLGLNFRSYSWSQGPSRMHRSCWGAGAFVLSTFLWRIILMELIYSKLICPVCKSCFPSWTDIDQMVRRHNRYLLPSSLYHSCFNPPHRW